MQNHFFFFLQLLIFWKDFEMGGGSTTWHGNVFTPRQTGFFPIYYLVWVLPSFTPRRFLTLLTWTFHVCIKQVTLIKKTVIRWKVGLICIFMAQVVTFFFFFFSHILFRRVHTRQSRKKYFVCVFLPKHHSLFWDLFFFSLKFLSDQVPSTSTVCSNMSSRGPCLTSFANFMKHIYALYLSDIGLE